MFSRLANSVPQPIDNNGGGKKKYDRRSCKKKDTYDVKKKTMTLKETEDWIDEAVDSPDEIGRCKREPRFTFKKLPISGAVRTSAEESLRVQSLVHERMASTIVPKILMTANSQLSDRLPKEATPVEFCGSMGFMSALLTELSSIPLTKRVEECIVDVKKAFPYGDIDLSVHVDRPESLAIAQRIIDNVVCDLKMTLDRLMFDEGIDSLRDLDLGEYYSPFMTDEYNNCRANCCQILPMDDTTIVRVDTPVIPGVDRRMRYSPLYISRNTSIKAGFTLTRLLLCINAKETKKRIVVPLLDISLALSAKRPCCPSSLFGCNAMAASAKSVCAHLEEMASGEGDPSKLEKRRNQLSVARKARQIFKSGGK
jgi:hypothetical protein